MKIPLGIKPSIGNQSILTAYYYATWARSHPALTCCSSFPGRAIYSIKYLVISRSLFPGAA